MCHALIIEDEIIVALSLQELLVESGATSFDIAETEEEAVQAAVATRPCFISAEVHLKHGTGPSAIKAIFDKIGEVPVIFVTANPETCDPWCPPGRVMSKPLNEVLYSEAFREMVAT